jgi:hypothetical protein
MTVLQRAACVLLIAPLSMLAHADPTRRFEVRDSVQMSYFGTLASSAPEDMVQILAHQEMLVDWFDFWLNGHEDSNAAKVEQYSRWRALRHARPQ